MQYHEVLTLLESVKNSGDVCHAVEHCVELILAHQTYGSAKGSTEEVDADIRFLLEKYHHYPFFLVFDYDADKPMKEVIKQKVARFMHDHYGFDGHVRYASVRARYKREA